MRRWWVHFPGAVYANGPFEAGTKAAAREWVLDWLGVKRLPRGTGIWEQIGPAWWEKNAAYTGVKIRLEK